jgi:chromate transporter
VAGEGTAAPSGASPAPVDDGPPRGSASEVFRVALGLGLTSFGGPIAHIGYFRRVYVTDRQWLDEASFADLVGLAQALPGPASSQLGMAIGLRRAGLAGLGAAWLGFTLPSAILMLLVAGGLLRELPFERGLVAGLQVAAVAVVAQALLSMARRLTPDVPRGSLAVAAAAVTLALPSAFTQVALIVIGALAGLVLFRGGPAAPSIPGAPSIPSLFDRRGRSARTLVTPGLALAGFLGALIGLPILGALTVSHAVDLAWSMYRAGALVFGGGHVVLPLLQASVVGPGWLDEATFLAGYGAAQAVPGPLFSFAAFVGAAQSPAPDGVAGGLLALVAIFLPGALLVIALMPSWSWLRTWPAARAGLIGVDAAVVGLLAAALWDPVIRTGIRSLPDALVAVVGLGLLLTGRVPPIAVVALSAAAGVLLSALSLGQVR